MNAIARFGWAILLVLAVALTGCGGTRAEQGGKQAASESAAPAGTGTAAQGGSQSQSSAKVQATLKAAADLEALLNSMSDSPAPAESDADDF